MATFLGAAAIVFSDPSFFLATFSLVLLSAALAIRFRYRMHRIITSAQVKRSADPRVLQEGDISTITTGFSCSPDADITVGVRDVLPPATIADPPDAIATVAADGNATIRYSLTPLGKGSIDFPGISLTLSDAFFTSSLVMGSDPFRGPKLEVHPNAAYERSCLREDSGEQEKNTISIYRGSGLRSIREYIHGDDVRSIDWKMTAKYDRIVIRQYSSVEHYSPLIVLDLPDRTFPVPPEHMAKLVNSVTRETVAAIRNYGSVSLFLISGVNIIDILLEETNLQRCIAFIRTSAHPQFRLHHAYRWKGRASMRRFVMKIEVGGSMPQKDESGHFLGKIAQIYGQSLVNPFIPAFSKQIRHVINSLQIEEIVLYSFFEGDLSHIREIALQAQIQRIRLKSRMVAGQDAIKIYSIKKSLGMDTVEVIP
jgi:hypothetical protein